MPRHRKKPKKNPIYLEGVYLSGFWTTKTDPLAAKFVKWVNEQMDTHYYVTASEQIRLALLTSPVTGQTEWTWWNDSRTFPLERSNIEFSHLLASNQVVMDNTVFTIMDWPRLWDQRLSALGALQATRS